MTGHPVGEFIQSLLDDKASWDPWIGVMIEHKGFVGHFVFNEREALFQGKVANIQDLVTFEGKTITKTHQAFREAVDAYIEWRHKDGREPKKSSGEGTEET